MGYWLSRYGRGFNNYQSGAPIFPQNDFGNYLGLKIRQVLSLVSYKPPELPSCTQSFQTPTIQEDSLNQMALFSIAYVVFLNSGLLEALGKLASSKRGLVEADIYSREAWDALDA